MLKLLNLIRKRPSDKSIRIYRIIFWMLLTFWMYYNFIYLNKSLDNTFFDFSFFGFVLSNWFILNDQYMMIFKYCLLSLWLFPIFMCISNICFLKKKYVRIMQVIYSFILFYLAWIMQSSASLDFDSLLWLMWIFPLLAWITWKCITSNCLKYKEKITKIRV